ncbi:hypothetical protein IJG14_08950 [bacterium]|nr:hypothetical protein [bacterium]
MFKIDYNNVRKEVIGIENGLDLENEFSSYSQKIREIIDRIYTVDEISTWLTRSYKNELLSDMQEYVHNVQGKFDNIIVVGLGSSVLGIKAMTDTVLKPYWNSLSKEQRNGYPTIHFISNIDPDNFNACSCINNWNKTLVIIVSKDGMEAEIMSMFMILKKKMENEIGENYRHHIVACTKKGSLFHQIANQEGYKSFVIPYEKVGPFAIISTCGLLPIALMGINIEEMLSGAEDMVREVQNFDIFSNTVAQIALIHYLEFIEKQKTISIMMSYSSRFKKIPTWCSQYKAEMLSKNYDKHGKLINSGQIIYSSHGCNDQHSLLQMLIEGCNNKIINIIKVEKFDSDCEIPKIFDYTAIGYLGGKTLDYLQNSEIEAMKMILTDYNIANITYTIPQITPYYIGHFMAMFMLNIVIQASLYNINLLIQTGTENLQNYICAQMGRYGYEETLREMHEKWAKIMKQSVLPE